MSESTFEQRYKLIQSFTDLPEELQNEHRENSEVGRRRRKQLMEYYFNSGLTRREDFGAFFHHLKLPFLKEEVAYLRKLNGNPPPGRE